MDYDEEQRNEFEALEAIFADDFHITSADPPRTFELVLIPNADGENNHVKLRMFVEYPATYPSIAPVVRIRNEKGLTERQIGELQSILAEKSASSVGEVAIYTIAEGLKEYLAENNKPELSMHEQMAQRAQARDTEEEERIAKRKALEERIEAKKKEPSPLGIEPGTLLTPESFGAWRILFDAEQKAIREAKEASRGPITNKLTGKQLFQQNLAKDLEESEVEKLELEDATSSADKEKVFYFQESLYMDEPDEGEVYDDDGTAKDEEEDDDDDDQDDEDIQGMFDTTVPSQVIGISAPASSSSASSSSSSTAAVAKKPAATPAASSSSVPAKSPPPAAAKPQAQPQAKKEAPKQQTQQKGGAGGKKK